MKKPALLACLLGAMLLAFGTWPAPAYAHAKLLKSTPKKGAEVASPAKVELLFSERLNKDFVKIQVRSASGRHELGKQEVTGATATQGIGGQLPPGKYEIVYRVLSQDGHRVDGRVPFTVIPNVASATPAPAPGPGKTSDPASLTGTGSDDSSDGGARWMAVGGGLSLGVAIGGVIFFLRQRRKAGNQGNESATGDG